MEKDLRELDEPVILQLSSFEPMDPPPDHNHPREDSSYHREPVIESFWAGRNHAMRRSARWAA